MSKAASPVFLRLAPSARLTGVLAVAHTGGAGCVLASDLPAVVRALLVAILAWSAWRSVGLHGWRWADGAIVLLVWDRLDRWRLVRRDGRVLDATLSRDGFCHPLLVVLSFLTREGDSVPLLIVPGMVDGEDLRRLRVRLRCASYG